MKTDNLVRRRAREALKDSETTKAACELLENWARQDPSLWLMLTESYISRACAKAINDAKPKTRNVVWKGEHKDTSERLKTSAKTLALYTFELPSGKPLGDATHHDLQIAARAYDAKAEIFGRRRENAAQNSLWISTVASTMRQQGSGKIVRNVLSEKQLSSIRARFIGE